MSTLNALDALKHILRDVVIIDNKGSLFIWETNYILAAVTDNFLRFFLSPLAQNNPKGKDKRT